MAGRRKLAGQAAPGWSDITPQEVQGWFAGAMQRGKPPSLAACARIAGQIEWAAKNVPPGRRTSPQAPTGKPARALLRELPALIAKLERQADENEEHRNVPAGLDPLREFSIPHLRQMAALLDLMMPTLDPPRPLQVRAQWHLAAAWFQDLILSSTRIDGRKRGFATKEGAPLASIIQAALIRTGFGSHAQSSIQTALRKVPKPARLVIHVRGQKAA